MKPSFPSAVTMRATNQQQPDQQREPGVGGGGGTGAGESVSQQIRDVKRNFKNRWSSGSAPEEEDRLLDPAHQDTPPTSTPRHAPASSTAAPAAPTTAQIQHVIQSSLLRKASSSPSASTMLSTTAPGGERKETIC